MDAVAATAAAAWRAPVKIAAWLLAAALALALGAAVGLGWKPLVTDRNPMSASFEIGPLGGSVTQSMAFPGGPVDAVTIWARRDGGPAAHLEVHLLRPQGGPPLRSARLEAPLSLELQAVSSTFAPIDLPEGPLTLRLVPPEGTSAALYVGATGSDAYAGGQLVDHLGWAPVDVDLAFAVKGHAGALSRLRAQAGRSPLYLGIGIAGALLAGALVGNSAWSSLGRRRFGRLTAAAVSGGTTAAVVIALLHGPASLA